MSPTAIFLTEVIIPWERLNERLALNYAVPPGLSELTTDAKNLATALKHQVDVLAQERHTKDVKKIQAETDGECMPSKLMSDISDKYKHKKLAIPARENNFAITAYFEYHADKFRFLRNVISVNHVSLGNCAFLESAAIAIEYWNLKRNLGLNWNWSVRSAAGAFYDTATLIHNPRMAVEMSQVQLSIVTKDASGVLVPFDPPEVRLSIMGEIPRDSAGEQGIERLVANMRAPRGDWIDVETDAAPPVATAIDLLFGADKGLIIGKIRVKGSDVVASFSTDVNNLQAVVVRNTLSGDGQPPPYPIILQFVILEKTHPDAALNISAAGYSI